MSRVPFGIVLSACLLIAACTDDTTAVDDGSDLPPPADLAYAVVDTGQATCYGTTSEIACPLEGIALSGQDANYDGHQPAYEDNGDGTITDLVTGLTWVKAVGEKVTWAAARDNASSISVGGHSDWRLPTIKEIYSLIDFRGGFHETASASIPYLDTDYFDFVYGDEAAGERGIDVQTWSATEYVSTTMHGDETVFGVNFADGRIKGYPKYDPRSGGADAYKLHVRYVRDNTDYGRNNFENQGDGTVTDRATGLGWQQQDAGGVYSWQNALSYCENLSLGGNDDWRLPNAKELQSIVDYARSPESTSSAAIDPVFSMTETESYFWTSTTHLDGPIDLMGTAAVYIAFGRALGYMAPPGGTNYELLDVHGAGSQRSDPKTGNSADYPNGHGPQGDDIRIDNYVRCVRDTE